jgi:hypothetical protein
MFDTYLSEKSVCINTPRLYITIYIINTTNKKLFCDLNFWRMNVVLISAVVIIHHRNISVQTDIYIYRLLWNEKVSRLGFASIIAPIILHPFIVSTFSLINHPSILYEIRQILERESPNNMVQFNALQFRGETEFFFFLPIC